MSSNIYQRIQDRDRYTRRLEDIVNFVDSFLDVNEKLNADDSALGDFLTVIPIKEYLSMLLSFSVAYFCYDRYCRNYFPC